MINSNLALEFMRSSVSGVSKTQILREFKKRYDLTPEDINKLIELCEFKSEPKRIKYREFYNNPVTEKAKRIYFPFTQIYSYEDFLNKEECTQLIEKIDSNLRPSTVSDPSDTCKTTDYRTSSTSDLHYFEDPYLEIDRKIADLMELPPFTGETMQGQKYLPSRIL